MKKEYYALHKLLRMPPSSFALHDFLSMKNWHKAATITSIRVYALANAWRASVYTPRGWEEGFDWWWEGVDLHGLHMRVRNQLMSATCWHNEKGILQYYRLFSSCRDLPFPPAPLIRACATAREAARAATSGRDGPGRDRRRRGGRKKRPQSVFIQCLTAL
eukprot:1126370-Pyramimonas_sp.AAC.1